jgi:hypothetical protein
MNQHYQSPKTR